MPRLFAIGLAIVAVLAGCGTTDEGATLSTEGATETSLTTSPTSPSTTRPSTTIPSTTTTTSLSVPRFPVEGLFTFASPSEIIPNGLDGAWDWQYTDPGAVYVDDQGSLHALQNGFVGWPAPVGVGYWRSDDGGNTWTEISEDPVFDGTDLAYVGVAALASSLIVTDDMTWVLYFYTWDAASWPVAPSKIGRATAAGPEGPWVADEEPVLVPGQEGEWDSMYVRSPSVVYEDGKYTMFYEGGVRDTAMIGMANSNDGINWTKYDDPTTTAAPVATSDPVLAPAATREDAAWDRDNVYQPRAVKVDETYIMSYASSTTVAEGRSLIRKLGLGTSLDGINWSRSASTIVSEGAVGAAAFWFAELAELNGELLLFVEVGANRETSVHLARASAEAVLGALGP